VGIEEEFKGRGELHATAGEFKRYEHE